MNLKSVDEALGIDTKWEGNLHSIETLPKNELG
jgi:hypothetical protein